ncbi:Uncharacterised protein [Mycobacteroides abscessus subsp. abscessus]|nr:Uncharacterised protein [Mycobacteroides abscessus subsp. abscessus]
MFIVAAAKAPRPIRSGSQVSTVVVLLSAARATPADRSGGPGRGVERRMDAASRAIMQAADPAKFLCREPSLLRRERSGTLSRWAWCVRARDMDDSPFGRG